ncbi:MAG: GNAT family N-acetyltransferase, partial [Bacteriovorax sp.]|nr:GNAT family N-acetyltransferase [Bacteriovorax sp.]
FLIMREGQKVLGYLSGCLDSTLAATEVEVPAFKLFEDLFETYPAHFHINFHPDCRGRGLGSLLVLEFVKVLKKEGVSGVHLVSSPEALNISFYERLGFLYQVKREFNQMNLLFMGKTLE